MSRVDRQPYRQPEGGLAPAVGTRSQKEQTAAHSIALIDGRYDVRRLDGNDFPELFALHRKIIDGLPNPELYLAKDEQYFKIRLDGDFASTTFILGAFCKGEMVAYSSVRFVWYESASPALVVTPKPSWQDITIAMMEDAAVRPDHRGHGIQALLNRVKADISRQKGVALHVALVDAKNFPSLRVLLGERFVAIGTTKAANGLIRLVLARFVDRPQAESAVTDPPTSDWNEITKMFLRGYVAVDVREVGESERTTAFVFARPST
jgi:GNAT superfamily N-acetyltransferase